MHIRLGRRHLRISPAAVVATVGTIVAIVVGIGTIFGWWSVRDPGPPIGSVEGKVRKAGRGAWHDVEGAWPGALLEYRVTARNSGGVELNHFVVTASVPGGIRVLPETCRYAVGSRKSRCPANWQSAGISRASLGVSASLTIVFQSQLRRGVAGGFQTVTVEANSDETSPELDNVQVKPRATHGQAAARRLVRWITSSAVLDWHGGSQPAIRSERLLADHWRRFNPERPHRFSSIHPDLRASVKRLAHDRRLDGRVVAFVATVIEEPNTYTGYRPRWDGGTEARGPRLTVQTFLVGKRGGAAALCVATREAGRRLHRSDVVRVRAVPITWSRASASEPIIPAVALDCAATRRIPTIDEKPAEAPASPEAPGRCE